MKKTISGFVVFSLLALFTLSSTAQNEDNAQHKFQVVAAALDKVQDVDKETDVGKETIEIDFGGDTTIGETFIAITAISLSLGMPIIIIAILLYFKHKQRRMRNELVAKFVDNGQEIPDNLLEQIEANEGSNFNKGVTMVCLGLGLFFGLGLLAGWDVGAIGFIPFFLGIAQIIISRLENKPQP